MNNSELSEHIAKLAKNSAALQKEVSELIGILVNEKRQEKPKRNNQRREQLLAVLCDASDSLNAYEVHIALSRLGEVISEVACRRHLEWLHSAGLVKMTWKTSKTGRLIKYFSPTAKGILEDSKKGAPKE